VNENLLTELLKKYPFIINPSSYKECGNILCISCYVENSANYFILYPEGKIKYKQFDDFEYTSHFNEDGNGNGIVFIDLITQELITTYYFKDDLNFDCPIEFKESSERFIITEHEERTHIIYLDDFSVQSFGGYNHKVYGSYVLYFPYLGYSNYDSFGLIDTITKSRVDLNEKLKSIIAKDKYNNAQYKNHKNIKNRNIDGFEIAVSIDLSKKALVYMFIEKNKKINLDLDKLFANCSDIDYSNSDFLDNDEIYALNGNWIRGFSLDLHTIKSTYNSDGSFNTERSNIGQLLYELKYKYRRENIEDLSNIICQKFNENIKPLFPTIDVIIPIPPSNQNRPFQPLYELCDRVSFKLNIKSDRDYLLKNSSVQIKEISDSDSRISILKESFQLSGLKYKDKTILLFDDLFRSGDTLNAATEILKQYGQVENIYVLTVTKTRIKR
jgi:competence protein ComFC